MNMYFNQSSNYSVSSYFVIQNFWCYIPASHPQLLSAHSAIVVMIGSEGSKPQPIDISMQQAFYVSGAVEVQIKKYYVI